MTTADQPCRHCYGIKYDASGYPCTCAPAKVAKVGRKFRTSYDDQPLRHSAWRRQVRTLSKIMLSFVVVISMCGAVVILLQGSKP